MLALLKLEGIGSNEIESNDDINNDILTDEEKKIMEDIEGLKDRIELKKNALNANNTVKNINLFSNIPTNDSDNGNKKPNINTILTLKGHFGKVQAISWASDSSEIVSASQDGKILVWNVLTGNKRLAISLSSAWTMCCDWSVDSTLIASGGLDNVCSIYDIENEHVGWVSKIPQSELVLHQGYISGCKFIDNGKVLTCSGDSSIAYWDIEYKQAISQWKQHSADVSSIDVNIDGKTFASVSCDSTTRIWDINNDKREIYSYDGLSNDINDVRWFPDYKALAVACDDSELILYDWLSRQKIVSYEKPSVKCNAIGIDFSKSGSYIIATYDGEPWCLVWNTLTGKPEQQLDHIQRPSRMKMSPDGYTFATGSWDNKIRLWG
mmetsp:Transcript_1562/g.2071  ORF Transcript_1562/g.2071 Transcript_1562/m.2071 type:complete len:380 (+) Transcript_1562:81-1220(+)